MTAIHTGSFRTIGGETQGRIAISRAVPRHTPRGYKVARELAPSRELFRAIKRGDTPADQFAAVYKRETLDKLDPRRTIERLQQLAEQARPAGPPTLLCWELPYEFCHRHLVADWLEQVPGVEVTEVYDPGVFDISTVSDPEGGST